MKNSTQTPRRGFKGGSLRQLEEIARSYGNGRKPYNFFARAFIGYLKRIAQKLGNPNVPPSDVLRKYITLAWISAEAGDVLKFVEATYVRPDEVKRRRASAVPVRPIPPLPSTNPSTVAASAIGNLSQSFQPISPSSVISPLFSENIATGCVSSNPPTIYFSDSASAQPTAFEASNFSANSHGQPGRQASDEREQHLPRVDQWEEFLRFSGYSNGFHSIPLEPKAHHIPRTKFPRRAWTERQSPGTYH